MGLSPEPAMQGAESGCSEASVLETFLRQLSGRIERYVLSLDDPDVPVSVPRTPSEIAAEVELSLPLSGGGLDAVLEAVDVALEQSVRTGSPRFMNQLFTGFSPAAFAGEVVAAVTNGSMYTYEMAPLATLVERAIIKRLGEAIGWRDADGILVTGGSNGNLVALLAARERAVPEASTRGWDGGRSAVLASQESHYSLASAISVLGLGSEGLISVPTGPNGAMDGAGLRAALDLCEQMGRRPLAVVCTAGTTVRGAFDPVHELIPIAKAAGAWVHVDAAWGGSSLLSDRHRHLLDGVDGANSLSWDPHKTLGVPLVCSAVVMPEHHWLPLMAAGARRADYLFHEDEGASFDLGRRSLQCGRRVDAWKLWFAWKAAGDAGLEARIDGAAALAHRLAHAVEAADDLELMSEVQWMNVCLRHRPTGLDDDAALDRHQAELRMAILEDGRWMLNQAVINGRIVLRPIISDTAIGEAGIDELVEHIRALGARLAA